MYRKYWKLYYCETIGNQTRISEYIITQVFILNSYGYSILFFAIFSLDMQHVAFGATQPSVARSVSCAVQNPVILLFYSLLIFPGHATHYTWGNANQRCQTCVICCLEPPCYFIFAFTNFPGHATCCPWGKATQRCQTWVICCPKASNILFLSSYYFSGMQCVAT